MFLKQKLTNPSNEMVFECTFDDLMENISRQELVDIGTGKIVREGLKIRLEIS